MFGDILFVVTAVMLVGGLVFGIVRAFTKKPFSGSSDEAEEDIVKKRLFDEDDSWVSRGLSNPLNPDIIITSSSHDFDDPFD